MRVAEEREPAFEGAMGVLENRINQLESSIVRVERGNQRWEDLVEGIANVANDIAALTERMWVQEQLREEDLVAITKTRDTLNVLVVAYLVHVAGHVVTWAVDRWRYR